MTALASERAPPVLPGCLTKRKLRRGLNLLIGPGLLSATGDIHRRQRKMLNPVFSAAYMRGITPFFYEVVGKVRPPLSHLGTFATV